MYMLSMQVGCSKPPPPSPSPPGQRRTSCRASLWPRPSTRSDMSTWRVSTAWGKGVIKNSFFPEGLYSRVRKHHTRSRLSQACDHATPSPSSRDHGAAPDGARIPGFKEKFGPSGRLTMLCCGPAEKQSELEAVVSAVGFQPKCVDAYACSGGWMGQAHHAVLRTGRKTGGSGAAWRKWSLPSASSPSAHVHACGWAGGADVRPLPTVLATRTLNLLSIITFDRAGTWAPFVMRGIWRLWLSSTSTPRPHRWPGAATSTSRSSKAARARAQLFREHVRACAMHEKDPRWVKMSSSKENIQ